jgi:hypothetical protein
VIAATARDYTVSVRLASSSTGEMRTAQVPLQGAEAWLADIRRACVQIAADRDLEVAAVRTAPVEGNVAADVQLLLRSTGADPWRQVHVSTTGGPTVVGAGEPIDVAVNGSAWLPMRLWPDDCGNPVGPLADGVPLRAAFSDDGGAMTEARSPTFRLRLDRTSIDRIARTLETVCTGDVPAVVVEDAGISRSGTGTSAGLIDMKLRLTTSDASLVEVVDPLAATGGRVSPVVTPVQVVDGLAEFKVLWTLPSCFDLLQGGPVLKVRLVSDLRRPYAIPLRGDELREQLQVLCGRTVGATVR